MVYPFRLKLTLVQDAILKRHELLIISEGTLLAGLYMHDNRWRDTAACALPRNAAKQDQLDHWLCKE